VTDADLARAIAAEFRKVAPERDPAALPPDQPIREALDLDSFDFLTALVGLSRVTGVEVPEADYGQLGTMAQMVRYFRERQTGRA